MKLHIVEDNIRKAVAATGRAGSEAAVLAYLASALAELHRGRAVTPDGATTCASGVVSCPFLGYEDISQQYYCVLSNYYLGSDDVDLMPRNGCTWMP